MNRNNSQKLFSAFLIFVLVFQIIAGAFLPIRISLTPPYLEVQKTQAAGEGWYDANWTRRKAITVTENSGSTLTNYQVKITVAYDSDMQADFDDIRFTDSNGTTSFDHWLESKTDSITADFWVEIPTLTASLAKTIYLYYGNAAATSASNGANTFVFFDDFEDGTLNKWTQYNIYNDAIISNSWSSDGIYSVRMYTDEAVGQAGIVKGLTVPDVRVLVDVNVSSLLPPAILILGTTIQTIQSTVGITYNWESSTITSSSYNLTFYTDISGGGADITANIDRVRVRKYASPEPIASVGSEEYFNYYTITGTGTMTAGGSQVITITAKTNLGNTYGYTGDKSLTFSGASVSGEGNNPTCSDKTSANVNFGTTTTITFASGVATSTMKLYAAESVSIDVTDGTINSFGSTSYDLDVVVSSPLSGMSIQINSNDTYAISSSTTLTLSATGASQMKFSNNNSAYSAYEAYGASKAWDITNATYGGTSSDGAKTVYAKYKDTYGNEAAPVSDNIVYDTTVPVNPNSAIDAQGAVSDTWQNNKNDPNFTSFIGASDANGIAGFYVYFGTSSTGTTTDWIATDAFDPASFSTSSARYLRVLAKDSPGNWADPDGAGTACDNTNANRPTDPDCWATIFIHKYDIDAPNTPSPVSSPASWTNTNSFNFSWTNPGDVGGSGVKDYTYQTNAGTSATTTANLFINGLTSNADGTKLFSVKANDNAGNSGANGTVNFYYDNTSPTAFTLSSPANGDSTSNSHPTLSWNGSSDSESGLAKYQLYIDGSLDTDNISSSATSATPSNSLSCGAHAWYVKAIDNAGNSTSSSAFNLTMACGSGLPPAAYNPPSIPKATAENPEGKFSVIINNNDAETNNPNVVLKLTAGADTKRMAISNTADFSGASQIPYETIFNYQFPISNQLSISNEQTLTVYVKFYTQYGVASETVSDSIILKTNITENQTGNAADQNPAENSNNPNIPNIPQTNNPASEIPNSSQSPIFTQTLQFGSNNQEVKTLQDKLKELNFFSKEIESNGNFGPATKQAVKEYQKSKGIFPNGIVGPRTRKALNNEEFITNKDYQFTQDLKFNDKNEEVKQLQTRLRDQSFFPYNIPSTGWFGPITQAAVNVFQGFYNLIQNGIVDFEAREVLNR